MKKINKLFLSLLIGGVTMLSLQSCWKDKTIRDRMKDGDFTPETIDIKPGYGVPILTYTLTCKELFDNNFFEEYNSSFERIFKSEENDLLYFVYKDLKIPFYNIDINKPTYSSTGSTQLINGKLESSNFTLHQLQIYTYAINTYNAVFLLNNVNVEHKDIAGNITPFSIEMNAPAYIAASGTGEEIESYVLKAIYSNPTDMLKSTSSLLYSINTDIQQKTATTGYLTFRPELHFPAWITINNWEHHDTVDFDITEYVGYNDSIKGVRGKELTAIAKIDNYFPLQLKGQIVLMDSNYNVVGNLFENDIIIPAGKSDNNYRVTSPTSQRITRTVRDGDELYQNLQNKVRYADIVQFYDSYNNQDVKLYKDNHLFVKLNAVIHGEIKGNIDDIIDDIESK